VSLQSGDHIGRYEIQDVIGEGGFGKVYRAWDAELERPVAIKALSGERWANKPDQFAEYRERFRLERRVQGQFQHPHIVSVYDLVQQDGDEYLVEEFVAGGTLRDLIRDEGQLPPERVVQIGVDMCQAIAAAWEQDVVHRDIKPSNILLTQDGQAKLSDFGVAQVGQMSQRTQSDNHHPGTPAYMSPEQQKGYGYLDERSDLYALSLTLYEALTGKSFKRERATLRQLQPDAPKKLDQVIARALAQDPDERYQRAAELKAALLHALDRPRRALLLRFGGAGVFLSALLLGGWLLTSRPWSQALGPTPALTLTATPTLPAPTSTRTPTPTSTRTPSPTPSVTPSRTPAVTRTRFTPTPSRTPTRTPRPTQTPQVSAPRLLSPLGAAELKSSSLTLRWEGELPSSDYGFRVSLSHGSGSPRYTSSLQDGTRWEFELPGDVVGEWRWSVAVVRGGETLVLARSEEWTFYYDPFDSSSTSSSPPDSPLPTPLQSPLSPP
jgi:serine/threonine protein kinase